MKNKELDNFINILLNKKFTFEKESKYYKCYKKDLGTELFVRVQIDKTEPLYCIILKHKFYNWNKGIIDISLNRNYRYIERDIAYIKKFINLYNKIYGI